MDAFVPAKHHRLMQFGSRIFELLAHMCQSIIEAREMKARFEAEAYRGRYRLISKNDDDLPIVH